MAEIVIRKKITLEFLGEDYKDCYLVFKALAISEYEKYQESITSTLTEKEALKIILGLAKDKFIEGKWLDQDIQVTDLEQFDLETLTHVINAVIGETNSPKG